MGDTLRTRLWDDFSSSLQNGWFEKIGTSSPDLTELVDALNDFIAQVAEYRRILLICCSGATNFDRLHSIDFGEPDTVLVHFNYGNKTNGTLLCSRFSLRATSYLGKEVISERSILFDREGLEHRELDWPKLVQEQLDYLKEEAAITQNFIDERRTTRIRVEAR